MKPAPGLNKLSTGLERSVEIWGDRVWYAICDTFPLDKPFTVAECLPLVYDVVGHISDRYARAIISGVLRTAELDGTAKRHGRVRWTI
jgi:hypothetical protein